MNDEASEILLADRRQAQANVEAQQRRTAPDIRQFRGIYWTRLILRVLSLGTCVAIAALLINAIRSYQATKGVRNPFHDGSGSFPVWPDNLKLYPTYALLGAAIVAGFLSLVLVLASFNKTVRRMTKTGNITTAVVSIICLIFWIGVTAYYGSWDTKETNWDLMSWSCTHQDPKYDYKNIDFSEFCTEMRFSFWAGVGLAGLEAVNLLIFLVWLMGTRRTRGYKKMPGKDIVPNIGVGF